VLWAFGFGCPGTIASMVGNRIEIPAIYNEGSSATIIIDSPKRATVIYHLGSSPPDTVIS
jgi:hypothetical protein